MSKAQKRGGSFRTWRHSSLERFSVKCRTFKRFHRQVSGKYQVYVSTRVRGARISGHCRASGYYLRRRDFLASGSFLFIYFCLVAACEVDMSRTDRFTPFHPPLSAGFIRTIPPLSFRTLRSQSFGWVDLLYKHVWWIRGYSPTQSAAEKHKWLLPSLQQLPVASSAE